MIKEVNQYNFVNKFAWFLKSCTDFNLGLINLMREEEVMTESLMSCYKYMQAPLWGEVIVEGTV